MTTGEIPAITPNPHDYWAEPERAEQSQRSLRWLQQHEGRFVASLEPVADSFVTQADVMPTGHVSLSPPHNYKQYRFETPAQAVHLVLDAHIKAQTNGASFLGIVSGANFERYGLQGRSTTVARGEQADERAPGEYAPVALAMPAGYVSNYSAQWLARLSTDALGQQAIAAAKAQLMHERVETLRSRAAAAELHVRRALLGKIVAAAVERTDPTKIEGWKEAAGMSDEAVAMRALDTQSPETHWSSVHNLAEVNERAAAGLLPAWDKLFVAAAVVMSDDEMRDL